MKKSIKLIFSILLIISIIGASPIILDRKNVEESNNVYEFALDAKGVKFIKDEKKRKEFYASLKENDISTITFSNLSIKEIAGYRDIRYMTVGTYLEDKEKFDYKVDGFIPKYASKDEIVIMLSKEDFLKEEIDSIKYFLQDYDVSEDDEDVLFYIDEPIEVSYKDSKVSNALISSKFFIDRKGITEVSKAGLVPMLSITNSTDDGIQSILLNEILDLNKKYNVKKVQMSGSEVIGFPKNTDKFLNEFKNNDISIVTTEFQTSVGLNTYLNDGQQNLIRGHEIPVNTLNLSNNEFAARIARAVKERNMRVIIITDFIDYRNSDTLSKSAGEIITKLKDAQNQLSRGYTCGIATVYENIKKHDNAEIFVALGSASIVGLLILSLFGNRNKSIIGSIICAVITFIGGILISKLQIGIGIKAYAFSIAIIGACSAIIIPYKFNFNSTIVKYFITSFLATLTGLAVASIMYGTEYILKLRTFSGVKLLYILPPVLIALWVILDSGVLKKINITKEGLINFKFDKERLVKNIKSIKWYHIVLVVLVVFGGIIYIKRSGNSGNASELELELRRILEDILYVRPRTKEFMLGYPAVLVAYYLCKEKVKYAQYVLIPGAIATMSTVNTFTHLHTPVVYSLLRTVYGIVLGLIVGLIYIVIFKQIRKLITKER